VQIEISAAVATLRQVEFVVRTPPQFGTLSAIKPHPRETNKGIVIYTHRGVEAPLTDRFTFACRVDGGPMSAPATVTLTGKKFEPILVVEDIQSLDRVFPGGEGALRFNVRNAGPAPFEGDFAWAPPWSGPPHITLKPAEKASFAAIFKPDKPGVSRSEMILQPGVESSKLPLFGECVRSVTVVPGELTLTLNPQSGAREGVLLLSNARNEPVSVKLRVPERIEGAAASLEIPARGRTRLSLGLAAGDVTSFHGELIVDTPDGSEKITLQAMAKPADLRVSFPTVGSVSLGDVSVGGLGRGEFRVRNVGGAAAVVQAQALTPFSVEPSNEAVRISPGAEATFVVTGRGEQMGHADGEIILLGGLSELKVPVAMEVMAATPMVKREPTAPRTAPKGAEKPTVPQGLAEAKMAATRSGLRAYLAALGPPIPADRLNPYLEQVAELQVKERHDDRIVISWKKPSVAPENWVIESASSARSETENVFVKVWSPMNNWKFLDGDAGRVTVEINSLRPGTQFDVRIMGVDREGKFSRPGIFTLATSVPQPLSPWFWIFLIVAALGITLYILLRVRDGELDWRSWFRKKARTAA
jgi:hypothetical protein